MRERGWVEYGEDVVLDEAGLVTHRPASVAEPVLEGRQGAHPTGEFDECSPEKGGGVYPRTAFPSDHQEPSQYSEQNEGKMRHDNQVR